MLSSTRGRIATPDLAIRRWDETLVQLHPVVGAGYRFATSCIIAAACCLLSPSAGSGIYAWTCTSR